MSMRMSREIGEESGFTSVCIIQEGLSYNEKGSEHPPESTVLTQKFKSPVSHIATETNHAQTMRRLSAEIITNAMKDQQARGMPMNLSTCAPHSHI